ncbi:MAG: MFS transporter [Sphingobium sp.]|nr:MFS transporter [Sphingobium sp.]
MPSISTTGGIRNTAPAAPGGRQPGAIEAHLLLMIACLPILGILVIAPVLPDMQRHFAATQGVGYLVPLALTAPALMIVLISPFAGKIAVAFGRKRALVAALCLYLLAATAPLWLGSLWAIIASRLVVGAAEALLMTISTMLLGDYFEPRRRDRYLGYQVIYTSVSAILFLVIGGVLGEAGWRTPFAAYAVTLFMIPLAAFMLWEPLAPVQEEHANSGSAIPWRIVLPICLVTFVAGGCMNLVAVDLGYLLEAVGTVGSTMKGLGAAANSAGIAIGAAAFSLLAGRHRIWHVASAFALGAIGFVAMAKGPGALGVIVGGTLAGIASGFYLGWLLAAVNRPLNFDNRGRVVGLWMSSYFLATVVAPASAVAFSALLGSLRNAMLIYAVALAALAVLAHAVLRER